MDPSRHTPPSQSGSSAGPTPPTASSFSFPDLSPPSLNWTGSIPTSASGSDSSSPAETTRDATSADSLVSAAVSAACLACRSKHLKCDGKSPCGRCKGTRSECIYVASRRGYKGPRRGTAANPNKRHASSSPPLPAESESCPMLLGAGIATSPSSLQTVLGPAAIVPGTHIGGASPYGSDALHVVARQYPAGIEFLSQHANVTPCSVHIPVQSLADRCLDSFYHHFHAAHPFVLPKPYLLQVAKDMHLEHLFAAIRWVGSLFLDVGAAENAYFEEAYRLAYDPATVRDGFLVQSLLLLVLGLDGSCRQEKARAILADVERIAVQIACNTRPFATLNGKGNPVLEESWRRTWWDLFISDGMIAGVHRVTNFLLFDMPTDVALPCEEHEYLSGRIPSPIYLEDIEDRDFSGDEREFSSFAYRIMAARNLGKFMRTPPIFGPEDENLARIEALLTNWRMHLPEDKRDALSKSGHLDEMIFQGHMMTHATSIMLHQPHSQLDTTPAQGVDSCAPHRPVLAGESFNTHTRHTITSANEISRMVTHRVPMLSHTHFFTCVVTLSSIVHLSKWALSFVQHDDDDLRQLIRLNIGALNKMSEVWRAANTASGQVRQVAQEIYKTKKACQASPAFWEGMTREEVLNSITADEGIMSEIETLAVQGITSESTAA